MGNKLVVVDVANVRPDRETRRGLLGRRSKQDGSTLASIEYIDSLLLAINAQIPCATVVAIADRVLLHRFETWSDERTFRERMQLPASDPEYIYVLPPQKSSRDNLKRRGRRSASKSGTFIKADELILSVAAARDGLVVSGDLYRDLEYRNLEQWLLNSHYLPVRDEKRGDWLLCAKSRAIDLSSRDRENISMMRSIAGIQPLQFSTAAFDRESDLLLRRDIFEKLIPQFWASKGAEDQTFTLGDRSPTVFRPFATLNFSKRATETREREKLSREVEASLDQAAEQATQTPSEVIERTPALAQPNQVRRRLAKTLWASNSSSNLRYLDQVVRMIGQVFQKGDGSHVLRWILPYGLIRIVGEIPKNVRIAIDVVQLQGLLRIQKDELVLDLNVYATHQVESFDLQAFYKSSIAKVREKHMQPKLRRWTLPISKRSTVRPKLAQESSKFRDIDPEARDIRTHSNLPIPNRPQYVIDSPTPASFVRTTKRSKIVLLIALIAVTVTSVFAAMRLMRVDDSAPDNDFPSKTPLVAFSEYVQESSAVSISGFYRSGKLVVKW